MRYESERVAGLINMRGAMIEINDEQTGHDECVGCAKFSPDGEHIVTASSDATAKLWDTATGKLIHTLSEHLYEIIGLRFCPTASRSLPQAPTTPPRFGMYPLAS